MSSVPQRNWVWITAVLDPGRVHTSNSVSRSCSFWFLCLGNIFNIHQNVQAEVFHRRKKFPMMLFKRSIPSLSRLLRELWLLFHIQWFFCYGPGTVQNMLPSFSCLSVFQPVDDTSEPVAMETTTQENLSFNLPPLPFPFVSENF